MTRPDELHWERVDYLAPGDKLATLNAWRYGASLVAIARRIDKANLQPATVLNVENHGIAEIRVTFQVGQTILSRGWRRGAYLPVYVEPTGTHLNMRDDDLTNVVNVDDDETSTDKEL